MANYRTELDALNALVDEQRKTNELLQEMITTESSQSDEPKQPSAKHGKQRRSTNDNK